MCVAMTPLASLEFANVAAAAIASFDTLILGTDSIDEVSAVMKSRRMSSSTEADSTRGREESPLEMRRSVTKRGNTQEGKRD